MRAALLASSIACSLAAISCADPCFDDGINQGGCPEDDNSRTESATEVASGSASMGDATADSGVATMGGSGFVCPMLDEVLLPEIATFQLVVDQSGSMEEDFGGVTRWDAVEDTLVGPDGVVTQLQSSIRFGISFYDNPGLGTCPDVTSLAPQLDAGDDITALFGMEMPGGDTPTGESVVQVTAELLDDPFDGEKIMVLATDGEPDTCEVPEPTTQGEVDMVRQVAVDAVAAAYDAGIRTFVISVGPEIAEEHLQDLANAGQGVMDGAEFYVANDTASLVSAFNAIISGLRQCTFPLGSPLPPEAAPLCSLTVNDTEFPFNDPDGWAVQADQTTLELQGAACDAIQEGVVEIQFQCSCE